MAVVCIPLMLIPKPAILISRKKKQEKETDDVEGKLFI